MLMIPITIDLAQVPESERRLLCEQAIKRGVPLEQVIREAMLEAARRTLAAASQEKAA